MFFPWQLFLRVCCLGSRECSLLLTLMPALCAVRQCLSLLAILRACRLTLLRARECFEGELNWVEQQCANSARRTAGKEADEVQAGNEQRLKGLLEGAAAGVAAVAAVVGLVKLGSWLRRPEPPRQEETHVVAERPAQ